MKKKRLIEPVLICVSVLFVLFTALYFLSDRIGTADREKKEEERLAVFLMQGKGVGKASVTLCVDDESKKVTGAAVVCEGGDDPLVRAEVTRLLCAALGIGANRVYVSAGLP